MTNNTHEKTAVLLVNLGTPDSLKLRDISRFLSRFLSDKRVVSLPRFLWWLILRGIVLPLRRSRVSKLYQSIWTAEGSPLQFGTKRLAVQLEAQLKKQWGIGTLQYAMTYSTPSIPDTLQKIMEQNIERLIVLPLFPQFSSTTTAAVFDKISDYFNKIRYIPSIYFIHEYASTKAYHEALEQSIQEHFQSVGMPERVLFSFHGIPVRYQIEGDPYAEQCRNLAETIAGRLKWASNFWALGFQSRFGWDAWLEPSSSEILKRWALEGVESVLVLSPSFSIDCLETLEELNIQHREIWMQLGGKSFHYMPALNDSQRHLDVLSDLLEPFFLKK